MIDLIGYLATGLVVLSFAMKNVIALRIVNALGCTAWIVYGTMLQSNPVIITNVGILAINLVYLGRNFLQKSGK
jgi:hypothetical protein